jgi:tRNA-specific 2-thiouridylase
MASDIFAQSRDTCLATGHYVGNVRLTRGQFAPLLGPINGGANPIERVASLLYGDSAATLNFMLSGLDASKDQSYFLYRLYDKPKNLTRYVFPLSEMTKSDVRRIASKAGLNIANKPDSQGICFIGKIKLADFIKKHVKARQGDVVNRKGERIGTHSGVQFYTVGQRHGFMINSYSGSPLYIVGKIPDENILIAGNRSDAYVSKFIISDFSFPYGIEKFLEEFNNLNLSVRVRNLGKKIPCKVTSISDSTENTKSFQVHLSVPEFGVAPGQSAVFYIERLMLGGGIIESIDFPYKK